MDLKTNSNINRRNNLSINPLQRSNYDISYVSVNTRGSYRHSVKSFLLCNSQTCVCSDKSTKVENNKDCCPSTRRIIVSDGCSSELTDLKTDMETRKTLFSDSIDSYKFNRCSCNVFMPNIKKKSSESSKEEYNNDECTSNYDVSCSTECLEYRSHGTQDMCSKDGLKTMSLQSHENHVKRESKVTFNDNVVRANNNICSYCRKQEDDLKLSEKSILNMYNQELINKNYEKNNRLQNVVQKLVEVREKEKQKESWNNFINELKNKHGYRSRESNFNIVTRPVNIEIIDDYVNTRFTTDKSGPCRHILQDIYSPRNSVQPRYLNPTPALIRQFSNIRSISRNDNPYIFENDVLCYPTSSQGRLLMLQREKQRDKFCSGPCHLNKITVPKYQTSKQSYNSRNKKLKLKKNRSFSIQTEEAPSLFLYQENADNEKQRECDEINEGKENEENSRLEKWGNKDEMDQRLEREREEFLREAEESLRREAENEKNLRLETEENSRLEKGRNKDEMDQRLEREREEFLREAEESVRREAENEKNLRSETERKKDERDQRFSREREEFLIKAKESLRNEAEKKNNLRLETESKINERDQRFAREREEFLIEAKESLRREAEELKKELSKRLSMEAKQRINRLKADEKDDQGIQVDINEAGQKKETIKERYVRVSDDVARLKDKIDESKNGSRENSFEKIESKLDTLIDSINSLIVEIKTKKCSRAVPQMNKCTLTTCISKKNLSVTRDNSDESYIKTGLREVTPKCCRNHKLNINKKCCRISQNQMNSLDNNTTCDIDDNQPSSSHRSSYRDSVNGQTNTSSIDKDSGSYERIKEFERPQKINTDYQQSSKRISNSDDTIASPGRSDRKICDTNDDKPDKNNPDSKNDKLTCICSISTEPMFNFTERFERSKFDRIIIEEIDKSNKARRDIENMLGEELSRPCEVQLTFDIPTKDISTEVTASLSKTKLSNNEQTKNSDSLVSEERIPMNVRRQMTIAVNTDPLSLLSLMRFSTETIGRLLSALNFNYNSYLSMIQLPQLSRQIPTSHQIAQYVCNICGAAFRKASELNDHIQGHDLGKARDCCVCRHILDLHRQQPGRFTCRYCGHCFTRAYCCELHQQSCARRLGKVHDINESLTLLQ